MSAFFVFRPFLKLFICVMPYVARGKCIFKKDGGAKVGCTKGSVKKYLAALHANANESEDKSLDEVRLFIRKTLSEAVEKKEEAGDDIHLPELTMKKKDLIKYLKELYNIELK